MNRIAIYARVSTDEQAINGYSIEEQLKQMRRYCTNKGYTAITEFVDFGYSAKTLNRPSIKKLINKVKLGQFDKVINYRIYSFF